MIKYEILDNNNNIILREEEKQKVFKELTTLLYDKFIVKSKDIKKINYTYSYDDKQKIIFVHNNNYKTIFYDISTQHGYLNI